MFSTAIAMRHHLPKSNVYEARAGIPSLKCETLCHLLQRLYCSSTVDVDDAHVHLKDDVVMNELSTPIMV